MLASRRVQKNRLKFEVKFDAQAHTSRMICESLKITVYPFQFLHWHHIGFIIASKI